MGGESAEVGEGRLAGGLGGWLLMVGIAAAGGAVGGADGEPDRGDPGEAPGVAGGVPFGSWPEGAGPLLSASGT